MKTIAILLFISFLLLLGYADMEVWAMNTYGTCPPDTEKRICGKIIRKPVNKFGDWCGTFPQKCR